jgi:hypothetical protein
MNKFYDVANWIAWRVLVWGSVYFCYSHHPTLGIVLGGAIICSGF